MALRLRVRIPMNPHFLHLYFGKLRMLYCSELQLISYLPELARHAQGDPLRESLVESVGKSRQRRDELELLANEHQISSAGDDCQSMRRLIAESRSALRGQAWHFPGDAAVADVSAALHRLQILNYGVARSLAGKARQPYDSSRLDLLLDDLVARFPDTCGEPVWVGLLREPQLALR